MVENLQLCLSEIAPPAYFFDPRHETIRRTSGVARRISRLTLVLTASSASLMSTQRMLEAALCSAGSRQLLFTISSSSSRTAAFSSGSVSKS